MTRPAKKTRGSLRIFQVKEAEKKKDPDGKKKKLRERGDITPQSV